ncbi:EAL domain-containing protein [Vibrio aestuarianus]|uniref:EAL domain-containing protein n=1 Tax=Vibrio aestuarianus TaxID=28171 RepID=A0A9X4FKR7_9VIBR|nr:EAL domain-containing protein [Vibrio aestuarianus]MDE1332859.1 EAL domain-containing protein [Vibrio aestuarianus]MDE1358959.1 EAL domain-containing protein [Vibrio aestuarianus]
MPKNKTSRPTIGVIMPMLSGFYMGELSATFRQLAKQHNANLVIIRSGEQRDFDLAVSLNHLDALLVVLHCASDRLVKRALAKNIPVISLAASYSPLPVEQFCSTQRAGIEALYDWLYTNGHTKIGFCGDLSVNDIRSRFKAYQDSLSKYNHIYQSKHVFHVDNCALSGGREAALSFIERESDCSAVICAADQNAIGMIEQLQHLGWKVPEQVAIVGVDNIFLGKQIHPQLTTVDQQLESLANQAFLRALKRIDGDLFQHEIHHVSQKLVVRESCGNTNIKNITSETQGSIRHALTNVQGLSPAELFESFYSQAKNGFNSILDTHGLYGSGFDWACMATYHSGQLDVTDWAERGYIKPQITLKAESDSYGLSSFPQINSDEHFMATIIPISTGQKSHWRLLAIVDSLQGEYCVASQAMFNNYLDMLSLFIERDELLKTSQLRQKNAQQLLQQLKVVSNSSNDGIWDWDLKTNTLHWNSRLIKMLGMDDDLETKHFDCDQLFEHIHTEDLEELEKQIQSHFLNNTPFKTQFRMRKFDDTYIWVQANGSAVRDSNGKAVRFIGSMTDITEQRESAAKIHHMAYFDSLTGVANRRKAIEEITAHIDNKSTQLKAVMLMDLNRFKMVNDSFGHHVGDALLCHVAREITQALGSKHTIARLGGDEFLLFCSVANVEQANDIAQKILRSIEKPMRHNQIKVSSQGSLGMAIYPSDASSTEELIKNADIAMYRAKQQGGGKYLRFSPEMHKESSKFIALEQRLSKAIDDNKIDIYYQPQVCNKSGKIVATEVLARWSCPINGQIPPSKFIPVAEISGLIEKLGKQVFTKVCEDISHSKLLQGLNQISINISARQLTQPDFANLIINTINDYQLTASLFCLEITETAAFTDYDQSLRSLKKLSSVGISISLDDFGTGFSSLSLLKNLPLSEVKIDRSFILDMTLDQSNLEFVSSMILMGQSLGYRVVAEGVETKEHVKQLSSLGVDLLQGYYYSKPLPLDKFTIKYQEQYSNEALKLLIE